MEVKLTIKVCKEKSINRLTLFGKVIMWGMQIIAPITFTYGIYHATQIPNQFGTICILSGMIASVVSWVGMFDDNIFQKINKKLKLFQWNEDC